MSGSKPVAGQLAALAGGIIFGVGLVISGMTDPLKVIAFLKLAAGWNPALIFVMGSALLVSALGYLFSRRLVKPWTAEQFQLPTSTSLDARLLGGAGLFGVGWGLAGYCPGPAIVGAFTMDSRAMTFLAAFLVGLAVYELLLQPWLQASAAATSKLQKADG